MKRTGYPLALLAVILTVFLNSCGSSKEEPLYIDPAFGAYISGYTTGTISKESAVRIQLAEPYTSFPGMGEAVDKNLFDFDPGVDGDAWWIDDRTIEFRPEETLESGEIYQVEFFLSKLVEVPSELKTFEFRFQTIHQAMEREYAGLKTYERRVLEWQHLQGELRTADVADHEEVEACITAEQNGQPLAIRWDHDTYSTSHYFYIDSIHRQESAQQVIVKWSGSALGLEENGTDTIEIPALGDFKLMSHKVVQQPEQYVLLSFSDPLDENQYLRGLIELEGSRRPRFLIEDNEVRIYPSERIAGLKGVTLNAGIKNILGYKMENTQTLSMRFDDITPEVMLVGSGVILPQADGLKFPFRAVNLRAVDVKVIQIYENNIGQFLQVNQLDGTSQLRRVGRVVHQETVPLVSDGNIDLGSWNTFSLDLDKLIEADPGAIYRVQLSFQRKHSLYPCAGEDLTDMAMEHVEENWDEYEETENSSWDGIEDYYYDPDYDWDERDNPCHSSYYSGNRRTVSRNVLASDLGIIAKGGNDRSMLFAVTDLSTTEPLADVEMEVYNYQQQLIESGTTGSDGMVNVPLSAKPYLLVAKKGAQRGYLRLDDGSSLSLSKFDVTGQSVQKGLKGFLYGERGVWRPGDSLFLTFILQDPEQVLPPNHPVSLHLIDPLGREAQKIIRVGDNHGFHNFITQTEADAPTGTWTAKVKVGGATFERPLRIETVKPNRLKLNLDFGVEQLSSTNNDISGELEVKWLHGAIARHLDCDAYVTLSSVPTRFNKYTDYVFDDPAKSFSPEEQLLYEGSLDENGLTTINGVLSAEEEAPGKLKASFRVRAYEESGDYSIDQFSIPYSPYTHYTGVKLPKGDKARGMLLTDTNHVIDIVTVDGDGNPVSRNNVQVELFKVNWRWWWEKGPDDELASYVNGTSSHRLDAKTIQTKNGFGQYTLRVDYPDWGRYMVRVTDGASGHSTGKVVFIDWPGWAGRAQKENPGGASMLTFSTDKSNYEVGEEVELSIPSGGVGRALVSLESGSRVVKAFWVEAEEEMTRVKFEATEDMAPNVFVHVTLVQPHSTTENDRPIRLYGITPIQVENPDSHLEPIITMPDVLEPEQEVTIAIEEKDDRDMTYTIAIVDEGLLDLTRFGTPLPWNHFYAREALGVKSWDMYDLVMGGITGEMAGLLAVGGDESNAGKKKNKANRFKPMVKFLGPFEYDGGTDRHTFKMPQYVGAVRTMVVAGGNKRYGSAEKSTPVKKPLMALATLPRVVGPGENLQLPVTVFALEEGIKDVSVTVEANEYFQIQGERKKSLRFNGVGDEVVSFDLSVAQRLGIGRVQVNVKGGGEEASHYIEVDVRNPNPEVAVVLPAVVDPGKTWSANFELPGMTGTNVAEVEFSSVPPINLKKRLKYLIQYPHGCVEQTTSSAFPQVYLSTLMDLPDALEEKTEQNVKGGIDRLKRFQLFSGGFGYWPGATEASDWGSSYAGHFLVEAKNKGYSLPDGMIKKWIKYQRDQARGWAPLPSSSNGYYKRQDLLQAYRLYTLALADAPELGAMNRLKERKDLSSQARWRLAAAYQLAGQPEVAQTITAGQSTTVNAYQELGQTYGSKTRDQALMLETMVLMDDREKAFSMLENVSASLSSEQWLSTQATAYSLLAVSKFIGGSSDRDDLEGEYAFSFGPKGDFDTEKALFAEEIDRNKLRNGSLTVKNTGNNPLFARLVLHGIPPVGDQTESENGLRMNIRYTDLEDNNLAIDMLEQGTEFRAEVTIYHPGNNSDYEEMVLNQIFPSGWEITKGKGNGNDSPAEYRNVRDDRVYTYFDLKKGQSVTYSVTLMAAYLGKFYLPTQLCEAMYDPSIHSKEAGQWVEVVESGSEL